MIVDFCSMTKVKVSVRRSEGTVRVSEDMFRCKDAFGKVAVVLART